jgi:hypothetical protein
MTSEPIRDPLTDHLLTPQRTGPVCSASCKQELSRSVGWAWRASCSGAGFGATAREVVDIVLTSRLLKAA